MKTFNNSLLYLLSVDNYLFWQHFTIVPIVNGFILLVNFHAIMCMLKLSCVIIFNLWLMPKPLVVIYKIFVFCVGSLLCPGKLTYLLIFNAIHNLIHFSLLVTCQWNYMYPFVLLGKKLFILDFYSYHYNYFMCQRRFHIERLWKSIPVAIRKSCIIYVGFYGHDTFPQYLYTCWVQQCPNGK